jgi:membrane protease YdiL (CAAX protease family)
MPPATRVVFALTSLPVALKEEIAFRALIQRLLAQRLGHAGAIVIASALFTAYHIGAIAPTVFSYGQTLAAGVILGVAYARTQSLVLVVVLHTLYDALWSATPIFATPLPYSAGLGILAACALLVTMAGWSTLFPRAAPAAHGA